MKTTLDGISATVRVGVWLLSALALRGGIASAQGLVWNFEYQAGAPVTLVWQSQADRTYDLHAATELTSWVHVDGFPRPGTGGLMTQAIASGHQGFFRITSEPMPQGELLLIPAGSFSMGDPFGEGWGNEIPVHTVFVSAVRIGKFEVTKALWNQVRAWGLTHGYTDLPVGAGKAADHPVYEVGWTGIIKWCNARSEMESLTPCYNVSGQIYRTGYFTPRADWTANGYRLPTEAEWEKAARGGESGKRFPWGDLITHGEANYYSSRDATNDVSATRGYHPSYNDGVIPFTAPVGSFPPNGYGLHDMLGNVREWCWDYYNPGYYASSPASDPTGPGTGYLYRILRGGGWGDTVPYLRCSYRWSDWPDDTHLYHGFRVARRAGP